MVACDECREAGRREKKGNQGGWVLSYEYDEVVKREFGGGVAMFW